MKHFLLLSLLLMSYTGFGQQPIVEWQKSLGGTGGEIIYSIQQTTDNGYIAVGDCYSDDGDVTGNHGGSDYWVVKLDSSGNITWQKSLGGSGTDWANSIQQTTDGGYIVAGMSTSNDGDITGNHGFFDSWIVKLDSTGNIIWQKSLGGSESDFATSIQQTTDGGYIIAGESESNDGDLTENYGGRDYWIVKLDTSGNITWQKSLGGSLDDRAYSIQQTTGGGYIVAGESSSNDGHVSGNNGNKDFWIVKLDALGNITWQKSLGGSDNEASNSSQQTTDGGYIVAGWSNSSDGDVSGNHSNHDYWVVKLDASGNITWQESLGGSGEDRAYSIKQTTDEGYIVVGNARSIDGDVTEQNGNQDAWTLKLDPAGNITWQNSLGGSGDDSGYSTIQTTDGGYIVAGASDSNDGDVSGNHGNRDFWVVKLSPDTAQLQNNKMLSLNLYPNPTSNSFTITSMQVINASFKIVDTQGKEVLSGKMNGKEQSIDISSLSKGAYSIVFEDSELPVLSVIKE